MEFWRKSHYSMKSTNTSKTSTDCCECFPIDDSKGYIWLSSRKEGTLIFFTFCIILSFLLFIFSCAFNLALWTISMVKNHKKKMNPWKLYFSYSLLKEMDKWIKSCRIVELWYFVNIFLLFYLLFYLCNSIELNSK